MVFLITEIPEEKKIVEIYLLGRSGNFIFVRSNVFYVLNLRDLGHN